MRISIRCKSVCVLKNADGEMAVSMNEVNEDDVAGAYSMIELSKSMVVEEIDKLDLHKDLIKEEVNGE